MPRLEDLPYPIASLFEEMLDQPDPSFRFRALIKVFSGFLKIRRLDGD